MWPVFDFRNKSYAGKENLRNVFYANTGCIEWLEFATLILHAEAALRFFTVKTEEGHSCVW